MMNPARTMRVSLFHLARSQWRNFENARIPTTAPTMNTTITPAAFQNAPASAPAEPHSAPMFSTQVVMLSMMNWYFPRISNMKLPDMPGSIIAQIAMAPLMNTNHRASGVLVGDSVQITTPRMTPKTRNAPSRIFHPDIPRMMKMEEATMSPKKNAQVWIGWSLRSICIRPASATTLIPIPATSDRRKFPLMCFQNSLILPLSSSLTASALMDAIEPTNSSYIPIMKAIVPPDTPGITSAAPMQAPLTATPTYFINPFITFTESS